MKYDTCRSLSRCAMFALVALGFWAWAPAQAEAKTCYANADDMDGDKYAKIGALGVEKHLASYDMHCPQGFVDRAGDCNDHNSSVHPRAPEVGYNGIDDNCNGMVDEPVFRYHADGSRNGTTDFTLEFKLNHPDIRAAALDGNLHVMIRYFMLGHEDDLVTLPICRVATFDSRTEIGSVNVLNVLSGRVYAVTLRFFRRDPYVQFTDIGPKHDTSDTNRYYTMTDSSNEGLHKRFQIVMKGLAEYDASQEGRVGYAGSERRDGQRYSADFNEEWCSEFYVWTTRHWVEDISGTGVEALMDFFYDHAQLHSATEIPVGSPGDYLPLDPEGDGSASHSAMFLAYDSFSGKVWTLEGNWGNEVQVKKRTGDWGMPVPDGKRGNVMKRLGHISPSMWR
jgi:hypothetical protein